MAERFRIALSLAGAIRAFGNNMTDILANQPGQDYSKYGKHHETIFLSSNLAIMPQKPNR